MQFYFLILQRTLGCLRQGLRKVRSSTGFFLKLWYQSHPSQAFKRSPSNFFYTLSICLMVNFVSLPMACGLGGLFAEANETDVGSTETAGGGGTSTPNDNNIDSLQTDPTAGCRYEGKEEKHLKQIVLNRNIASPHPLTFSYFISPSQNSSKTSIDKSIINCSVPDLRGFVKNEPVKATGCTRKFPNDSNGNNLCLVTIDSIANDLKTLSCEQSPLQNSKRLKSISLNDRRLHRAPSHLNSSGLSLLFCYSKTDRNLLTHFIVIEGNLLNQTNCETFADKNTLRKLDDNEGTNSDDTVASPMAENRIVVSNHLINFEDKPLSEPNQLKPPYLYVGELTGRSSDSPDSTIRDQLKGTGPKTLASILAKIGIEYDKLNQFCEQSLEKNVLASIEFGSKSALARMPPERLIQPGTNPQQKDLNLTSSNLKTAPTTNQGSLSSPSIRKTRRKYQQRPSLPPTAEAQTTGGTSVENFPF